MLSIRLFPTCCRDKAKIERVSKQCSRPKEKHSSKRGKNISSNYKLFANKHRLIKSLKPRKKSPLFVALCLRNVLKFFVLSFLSSRRVTNFYDFFLTFSFSDILNPISWCYSRRHHPFVEFANQHYFFIVSNWLTSVPVAQILCKTSSPWSSVLQIVADTRKVWANGQTYTNQLSLSFNVMFMSLISHGLLKPLKCLSRDHNLQAACAE